MLWHFLHEEGLLGKRMQEGPLNERTVSSQAAPQRSSGSRLQGPGVGALGGGKGEGSTERQGRGQARKANWRSHLENAQRKAQM